MAEDYLTDDEQWEAVKRWLAENLVWLIAGVIIGAGLLFGWRYVESYREQRALRAAAQFEEMTAAIGRNDRNTARALAAGLIKDYPSSPYADQAQLSLARLFIDDGQDGNAVAPLTVVMNESKDTELQRIARLRLARVLIDQGKPDDAIALLAKDSSVSFAGRYHEVRGDAFVAKKDTKSAVSEYKAAVGTADPTGVDASLLELKIADLSSAVVSEPSNKAKP